MNASSAQSQIHVAAGSTTGYFTRWPPSCKIIIKFMVNNKLWSVLIIEVRKTEDAL